MRKCGRHSVAQGARFFAYNSLIINFKGVLMKLKIIAFAISVDFDFFYILKLSYKPSNFARAILPYAAV